MDSDPLTTAVMKHPSRLYALSLVVGALLAGCDGPEELTGKPEPAGPAVARVTVEPDSTFLLVADDTATVQAPGPDHAANARARILAVARDAAGDVISGVPLRFESSAPGIAAVSDAGVIRGVAPGTAVITIRAGSTAAGRLHLTVQRPYTLTFLGTLPGASESRPEGINDLGQVVGFSGGQPFLWENGAMSTLTFPGVAEPVTRVASLAGINDLGEVGGTLETSSGYFAFLRREGGTVLAANPHGGVATAMNGRGEVVGAWKVGMCTRNCGGGGWILRDGEVTALSNFGQLRLETTGIDDTGQISGTLFHAGVGTETGYAVRLAGGQLAYLSPDVPSSGNAIDAEGRVVGWKAVPGKGHVAFLWEGAGGRELGALHGGNISRAEEVNDLGHAVGRSHAAGYPLEERSMFPVLFRDGKVIRIEDLFLPGEWIFEAATGINDRGQIIGRGKHRSTGATGAVLLTPPQ